MDTTREWSEWIPTSIDAVDPSSKAYITELTIGLEELLSNVAWSSATQESENKIKLLGTHKDDRVVPEKGSPAITKQYDLRVTRVGGTPPFKELYLIRKLQLQVIDETGRVPSLNQEGMYEFTAFFDPFDIDPPDPYDREINPPITRETGNP